MNFRCFLLAMAATIAGSAFDGAYADQAQPTAIRSVRVDDGVVDYKVGWSETVLKSADGIPDATISATSYVREGAVLRTRPVVFAFNGGPGAASGPLHFGLLGPRRRVEARGEPARFADNPETLLDVADLVLIDPVGTGFSRELRPGGAQAYWSVKGDAQATVALIREWLRVNGREASPIFIVGESYGGFRAATLVQHITDLNVAGIVLVSPGLVLSVDPDQNAIFEFPSMAAAAFAHGRAGSGKDDVAKLFEEARQFAQTEYAAALQRGNSLPKADKIAVARRMSAMIGIPEDIIAEANLRLSSQDFLEKLLPGQVVGRIDTRVAAPAPKAVLVPGRDKAADDPALGMGKSNVIVNAGTGDYLREIGVDTDRAYIGLSLDVNFAWNWNSGSPKIQDNSGITALPGLEALHRAKPGVPVMLVSGYYDLATPLLAQRYALEHSAISPSRIQSLFFASGHTVFNDDPARIELSRQLRRFVTSAADAVRIRN
ncbi:hypothetical protein [Sphingosinicella sp.]|uniref:S10 family serine carboxypeptidase-like protein n=1 Tax=Sphingosinicella sp. TaxID=1917971 RepID=UPI0035B40801